MESKEADNRNSNEREIHQLKMMMCLRIQDNNFADIYISFVITDSKDACWSQKILGILHLDIQD